jgi:hypothetical protein
MRIILASFSFLGKASRKYVMFAGFSIVDSSTLLVHDCRNCDVHAIFSKIEDDIHLLDDDPSLEYLVFPKYLLDFDYKHRKEDTERFGGRIELMEYD